MKGSENNSKKRKAPARKKRASKKAKIRLDTNKMILMCVAVALVCMLLLVVTAALTPSSKNEPAGASQTVAESDAGHTESEKNQAEKSGKPQIEKPQAEKARTDKTEKAPIEKPAPKLKPVDAGEKKPAQKTADKKNKNKDQPAPIAESKPEVASPSQSPSPSPSPNPPVTQSSFGFPEAAAGATLVIIFDDGGQNMSQLEKCVTLPFPVTVAVLPKLSHSAQAAERVRKSGNEVILHQPMQSVNLNVNPGPGAILPEMHSQEIEALLHENIREIAPIAGMNNHEGSLITEDENRILVVMQVCHDENIFFLDSRTTTQTKVPSVAMEMGYSYYQRDVFLDNTKKREDIIAEIQKGLKIANRKGCAIMIGHVWSAEILPAVLNEVYPELVSKGYRFTTVSKSGSLITP